MYEDIYVLGDERSLATAAELDALEAALGMKMPYGYREFWLTLGEGEYCGAVEMIPPRWVAEETEEWRSLWFEEWYYENPPLERDAVKECVIIAKTASGDQLFFYPSGGRFYFTGRSFLELVEAGSSLRGAISAFASRYTGNDLRRPFFLPQYQSGLTYWAEDPDGNLFVGAVEAVGGLGAHTYFEVHEFDCAHFFFERQRGFVRVYDPGGEVEVVIHGLDEHEDVLNALVERLEALGFEGD